MKQPRILILGAGGHGKAVADLLLAGGRFEIIGFLDAAPKARQVLGLPVLGFLRDTQNYVHLAARGLTLFDVAPGRVEKDLAQWQDICRWMDTP